jgi:uncharacterized protein
MKRVVVVADTHMPRRNRELPRPLLEAFAGADAIFHLGDFTTVEMLDNLRRYGPVHAVYGNNDDAELTATLPLVARIEIGARQFLLMHGHVGGPTAVLAARATCGGDAVLFGHSHRPFCSTEGGRLLFNPGSPTERRWSEYRSFGVIEVGETLRPSIRKLP